MRSGLSRRQFLTLAAAMGAATSLIGCTKQPPEKIVPRVRMPEYTLPGKPQYFATAFPEDGFAHPVLVESHGRRPTRIEGNAEHPTGTRACTAIAQASIWDLYHPDRAQAVTHKGLLQTEDALFNTLRNALRNQTQSKGDGVHIVIPPMQSPTLHRQLTTLHKHLPQMHVHWFEAFGRNHVRQTFKQCFGATGRLQSNIAKADVIVDFDHDFLMHGPTACRDAAAFAQGRRISSNAKMNRLYVAEPVSTVTGAAADARLAADRAEIAALILSLAAKLGIETGAVQTNLTNSQQHWLDAVTRDLRVNGKSGLVLIGDAMPTPFHTLVTVINQRIGAYEHGCLQALETDDDAANITNDLSGLADALENDAVDLLLMIDCNPVYQSVAGPQLATLIENAGISLALSAFADETARVCAWHVPLSHYLESWSDRRTPDGVATILQPLIRPLYRSLSVHELLAALIDENPPKTLDIVQETWRGRWTENEFESHWRRAVHDGYIEGTEYAALPPSINAQTVSEAITQANKYVKKHSRHNDDYQLEIALDHSVRDGSHSNNPWLQELPDPLTKITWGNAALVNPATAEAIGGDKESIEIIVDDRSIEIPLFVLPGVADGCIGLSTGYGRDLPGQVGHAFGTDVNPLRRAGDAWSTKADKVRATNRPAQLATTQSHHSMEGRDLIRTLSQAEFMRMMTHDDSASSGKHGQPDHNGDIPLTLYDGPPAPPADTPAWGMMIDLTSCIGCNACSIACQAENNIPTVGKQEVARGREMHWIRVDRYFDGPPDDPDIAFQPVTCMHCEQAPCEVVCPVNATVHGASGLNEMVYNRCVGTRYCSNNCPYKVRRFNFFDYVDRDSPTLALQRNPDVTVRSRGVMEKCTYCVQRISQARIDAKKDGRAMADGDVLTACQTACPTEAIIFGDLNDPNSRVSQLRKQPHAYGLLTELNTRPRTNYLSRVRNQPPHGKEA